MTTDSSSAAVAEEIYELVESIKLKLMGRGPMVQGAVIASLLAQWVHGHKGERERAKVMENCLMHVLRLVEIYDGKDVRNGD